MRAQEFIREDAKKPRFADGYLAFSDHFEDRLRDRNISKSAVLQFLNQLERRRSVDLIRMPFIAFVVKSPDMAVAFNKHLDKSGNTAYVATTVRSDLRSGEDQDIIYLEEDSVPAEQILKYVKSIHHDFHIDDTILTHPEWQLTRVPLSKLHIPDPESGEDLDDPYNRVQMIDMYHVDDITRHDIERKPIVVDTDGHIIDGNHRALAARLGGMTDIPAYVPVALKEDINHNLWLYHATYRPLLKSIKAHGLGGDRAQAKWEDSKPGVVYLARDPDVAESYAESSDVVPDEWLDQIVVLKIRADQLDPSRLFVDQNVQDNAGDTLEYHGVIPVTSLSLTENFADGKVRGKSRPGRVKRAGASCAGSVTDLRAKARKYGGERGRMYHWCANMKGGKKK